MTTTTPAAITAAAAALATALGQGWSAHVEEETYSLTRVQLCGPAGAQLYIRAPHDETRWSIAGQFPQRCADWRDVHSICQSWTRPSKTLAADLQRRLMPGYRETYARLAARQAHEDAQDQAAEVMARTTAEILPGARVLDRSDFYGANPRGKSRPVWEVTYSAGEARFTLKTRRALGAVVELAGLTDAQVYAVAAALAETLPVAEVA